MTATNHRLSTNFVHDSANICGLCSILPRVTKEDIFEFGVDTTGRAFIDEKTADGCRRMLLYFVWQDELVDNQETKDTQEHIFGTCSEHFAAGELEQFFCIQQVHRGQLESNDTPFSSGTNLESETSRESETKNQRLKPANQKLKSANQKPKSHESETKNRANQKLQYRNQIQNPANQKLRIRN